MNGHLIKSIYRVYLAIITILTILGAIFVFQYSLDPIQFVLVFILLLTCCASWLLDLVFPAPIEEKYQLSPYADRTGESIKLRKK